MISSQDISPDYVYRLQGGTSQNLFTIEVCLFCKYSFIYLVLLRFGTNLSSGDIFIFYKVIGALSFSPIELN